MKKINETNETTPTEERLEDRSDIFRALNELQWNIDRINNLHDMIVNRLAPILSAVPVPDGEGGRVRGRSQLADTLFDMSDQLSVHVDKMSRLFEMIDL